jgi:SAM-dependent MidA family methyltransferase
MNDSDTDLADQTLAQAHSETLKQIIIDEIDAQGGWIDFARYMQLCLYHPRHGYYQAGNQKFGREGDFITGPELTPLFGYSLAQHIADASTQMDEYDILEFGAGTGRLAVDVLIQLERLNQLPRHYFILDVSAELKHRQQTLIQAHCPRLFNRIQWLESLPVDFTGVIIANEVCDAMPSHRIRLTETDDFEIGVSVNEHGFIPRNTPLSNLRIKPFIPGIRHFAAPQAYDTEINLNALDWISTLAEMLSKGLIFIIDYGYDAAQFYSPERSDGTLHCYFQHQAHQDPFLLPGLQDITTHVNFTQLAEQAQQAGLGVSAYQEQSDFLIAGDIMTLASQHSDHHSLDWIKQSAAIKQLLMPNAMGHQFKVLSLTKDLDPLARLQYHDRRYQL